MPNTVFRGPADRQPHTAEAKTVAGAYLPCTFVTEGASTLTQATAPAGQLRLLSNRDFYSTGALDATDPLKTAYASGDTGIAYILEPGQRYLVAVAAATYTFGQELTVAAAGRAAAAATGNQVVAFSREAGVKAAGDLIEVEIANCYAKP
ncbi:hypothetical protein [Aquabacterium sp. OR-4]|uniref:hypothetical protein n=1 Tax=Aquabacterium sp. OR-4 TaxID=2978127 RepID=UPI0021B44782|nr:hypothetical protein [Aquabacterium sp. OR-4]MDT7834970.1 hypothetical protein [Aquabacterium sp. OR-4]